jgi:hypothetical protein
MLALVHRLRNLPVIVLVEHMDLSDALVDAQRVSVGVSRAVLLNSTVSVSRERSICS